MFSCLLLAATLTLPAQTIDPNPQLAEAAVAQLRAEGQSGVDAMIAWHEQQRLTGARETQYRAALDRICRQRDCAWSGLYWYTDLAEAERVAAQQFKPVLTLRLLGNLDEDLSCANSRFFRTILYSDRRIARYLRENFVLHWQSVRPVPKVTIDFGDGRTMVRTLTGNSIHYIIASDGTVIDALPGLYAPEVFLEKLKEAAALHHDTLALSAAKRAEILTAYHRDRADGAKFSIYVSPVKTAIDASKLAMSKSAVEVPMLNRVSFGFRGKAGLPAPAPKPRTAAAPPMFDQRSLDLIRSKRGTSEGFEMAVLKLEGTVAEDTLTNENGLHRQIHALLAQSPTRSLDQLNSMIYDELFMTPSDDRWLGLLPPGTFSAIERDGLEERR